MECLRSALLVCSVFLSAGTKHMEDVYVKRTRFAMVVGAKCIDVTAILS